MCILLCSSFAETPAIIIYKTNLSIVSCNVRFYALPNVTMCIKALKLQGKIYEALEHVERFRSDTRGLKRMITWLMTNVNVLLIDKLLLNFELRKTCKYLSAFTVYVGIDRTFSQKREWSITLHFFLWTVLLLWLHIFTYCSNLYTLVTWNGNCAEVVILCKPPLSWLLTTSFNYPTCC